MTSAIAMIPSASLSRVRQKITAIIANATMAVRMDSTL
jgi:3-methyladenine DNA glycosylase Tag